MWKNKGIVEGRREGIIRKWGGGGQEGEQERKCGKTEELLKVRG
jgi:hypothetical protein